MSLWQRWKKTTIANQALVATGILVAVSTFFYAGATAVQVWLFYKNAAEASKQADKLIGSAERIDNTSAQLAKDTRDANRELLEKAERITRANEGLASTANKQADASITQAQAGQASARAAEQSASVAQQSMIVGTRPYVAVAITPSGIVAANRPVGMQLRFINDGNSPAYETTAQIQLVITDSPTVPERLLEPHAGTFSETMLFQPTTIQPHRDTTVTMTSGTPLTSADFEAITHVEKFLLLNSEGSYKGVGGSQPIKACWRYYYNPSTGANGWDDCIRLQQIMEQYNIHKKRSRHRTP